MTTNLQELYKDVIDSELDESLKVAFIALLETAVPENEVIVKNKIKRMLDEYILHSQKEKELLDRIDALTANTTPATEQIATVPAPQTPNQVITPVQPVTNPVPVDDAQAIANIQNQLQAMQMTQSAPATLTPAN